MPLNQKIKRIIAEQRRWDKDEPLLPSYAWPGGYPIYYIDKNGYALCPDCAIEEIQEYMDATEDEKELYEDDLPVVYGINYEEPDLFCEGCNEKIECAYCDDD